MLSKKNPANNVSQTSSNNTMQVSAMNNALSGSPIQQQQQLQQQQQQTQQQSSQSVQSKLNNCNFGLFFIFMIFLFEVLSAPIAEPLFVTVPPRPQRVLHSEAYIKYIEGLQNDTRFITPWEKTLKANPEATPIDPNKLPFHWLGPKSPEKSSDSINALWQLRNYMMKDVLHIVHPSNY